MLFLGLKFANGVSGGATALTLRDCLSRTWKTYHSFQQMLLGSVVVFVVSQRTLPQIKTIADLFWIHRRTNACRYWRSPSQETWRLLFCSYLPTPRKSSCVRGVWYQAKGTRRGGREDSLFGGGWGNLPFSPKRGGKCWT